ncbi:uncharacterized protein [Argopecten irradians]|uniref:uncharacterized protein n=1 Tax=Argopecten irradians TaxID=31199 RepID=UPI0037149C54
MENEEDHPAASLAISNILDKCGFSSQHRRLIKSFWPFLHLITDIVNIHFDMPSMGLENRLIGSAGEGLISMSAFNNTTCDADVMAILANSAAYEDRNSTVPQGHWQFRMEPCNKDIGYVRMRLVKEGSIFTLLATEAFYERENEDVRYLSNKIPDTLNNFGGNLTNLCQHYKQTLQLSGVLIDQIVTGPSLSAVTRGGLKPNIFAVDKVDTVISIPCPKWPAVAKEWAERKREYNWPSANFVTEHVKNGCYVVPVGCKECDRTYLDWRLSFVLVEQALIWDFNSTQLKCYLLLKQIKKFVFEDKIGDIISSYILKTTVFWVIEESPPDLWVPHRLLKTVQLCLDRLIASVRNDFCPNYFIRICNLLAKRYNTTEKHTVLSLCYHAKTNLMTLLCETPPFNEIFPENSVEEIASDTVEFCDADLKSEDVFSVILTSLFSGLSENMRMPLACQQSIHKSIQYCNTTVDKIKKACLNHDLPLEKTANVIADLELISRRLVWTQNNVYEETTSNIRCIPVSQHRLTDYEALMENITIIHLNVAAGNTHLAYDMIRSVVATLKCRSYVRLRLPYETLLTGNAFTCFLDIATRGLNLITDESVQSKQNLSDFLFLRFEIDVLPQPLQMEMLPHTQLSVTFDLSSGMRQMVAIDPAVYACFLKFWCAMKLKRNIDMLVARDDMVWCCSLPDITNKAVAFNLLGYCHKQLEEYDSAFGAFCRAWEQRPQSEATLVHIFALVHSIIRRELNETCPD